MIPKFEKVAVPHEIFLLRHGETDWNHEKRMQGRIDRRLTEHGKRQAQKQGDLLASLTNRSNPPKAFVSPMGRTQQTAEIALKGREFVTDPRITEMSFGAWEGTTHAERLMRYPEILIRSPSLFLTYANAPHAEPLGEVFDRCSNFLSALEGAAVIVSHLMPLTVFQALLIGRASRLDCDFTPPQGGIMRIKDGQVQVYQSEVSS